MLLGPIWGAVLGGLIDISAFFIWHSDLNYIFYFSLLSMLRGFLAGYIYNYIFKNFNWKSVVSSVACPHLLISGFLIPLFSIVFYYIFKGMSKSTELKKLHNKLEELAKTDDLTGLSNRRHFMEFLDKMISLSKR